MSEKSIRYIVYVLKAGLYILPVLSLIVVGSFFFPFITGKNFFFRIMVEILFFLWVFVACFDKNYRPKKSPILIAISATLFFLTLSTIFGANPYRSFWSNYERMEGLVGHIHLFLYFLILVSVLRTKKDWKWFFTSLLGFSFILTVYGFLQFFGFLEIHQSGNRLDATLGNATYYAIFMIFSLFLVAYFLAKTKNKWLRLGLGILFVLDTLLVFMTATRGAILGLIGAAFLFAILVSIFSHNKKIHYGALGVIGSIILVVTLFLVFKNTSFIQNNYVLTRFSGISFSETTTQSRLTIWQMAFKGFLERPFLGWGPENFNIMWNKYFEPILYKQEPWFDRAHNIIFDWLISSGILGFLAYWSIWGAAIFVLIKGYRKKQFSAVEISLFSGLFAAYAFHNLFVFDNLTSYFLFFSILGYLHFRGTEMSSPASEQMLNEKKPAKEIGVSSYLIITAAFIAVFFGLYFVNLKPLLACRQLLKTLDQMQTKGTDVDYMLKEFDKVFSYNTFGTIEAREQLGSYAQQVLDVPGISNENKTKAISAAIAEMEKQVKILPNDARAYVFLTALYTKAGRLNEAMKAGARAIELSPKKQQIHFVVADVYLTAGQYDKAFEVLKEAYELDRTYSDAARNLAMVSILAGKKDLAEKLLNEPEENWPAKFGNESQFINIYARAGNYEKMKELWQVLILKNPNNAQLHVNLAATYLQLGERENAVKELEKAIELEPKFKEQGEYYIKEIRAGRNP